MNLSPKQKAIMDEIGTTGEITLSRAVELVGGNLYCNAEENAGAMISVMLRRGLIERVRPGVFWPAKCTASQCCRFARRADHELQVFGLRKGA